MLTEYKSKDEHYYVDDQGRMQGESTERWDNGQLRSHCFVKNDLRHGEFRFYNYSSELSQHSVWKDGKCHGEYKWWDKNGHLEEHSFYKDDNDITNQVKELVEDINNITNEDKLIIKIKFGIKCLC